MASVHPCLAAGMRYLHVRNNAPLGHVVVRV